MDTNKNAEQRQSLERRKEPRMVTYQDRRIAEWRRAADRHEAEGNITTAMMFRNDALRLEQSCAVEILVDGD